jgi:hypothetical protein
MIWNIKNFFVFLIAALALSGCRSASPYADFPVVPVDAEMRARAAAWRKVLPKAPICGVEVGPETQLFYAGRVGLLIERLRELGINRIYLTMESIEFLDENEDAVAELVTAAAAAGIKSELYLPQRHYLPRRDGSVWRRKLSSSDPLSPVAGAILDFNAGLPDAAKLAGVTVKVEIHTFTKGSRELPSNALYAWSDEAYGVGQDNDMLMRLLLDGLEKFRGRLGPDFEYTVAIPDFYHDQAAAGKLSCGSIVDFLRIADRVIITGAGRRPSDFALSVVTEFQVSGTHDGRLLLGVGLASHASENQQTLRRRDWPDVVNIIEHLAEKAGKYPSFGGTVFSPWRNLELLWEI